MANPGNTWGQLLQQIATDFSRLDLTSSPTPLSTDLSWIYATQAIQRYQSKLFIPGQAYNQWVTTIPGGLMNYYALPPDFEDDMQILQLQFGYNNPLVKCSEMEMNRRDIQFGTPIIGQSQFYCIYGTAANIFADVTNVWQPNFNYSQLGLGGGNNSGNYYILDSNGNIQALSAVYGNGTSGSVQPVWGTQLGQVVTDPNTTNGVQWTCVFLLSAATATSAPVLRLWPWPDQAYLMTAVYQNKIPVPTSVTTSNFWTVDAEALIRFETEGILRKNVFHEPQWVDDFDTALTEFRWLSGRVRQTSAVGRAKPCYL